MENEQVEPKKRGPKPRASTAGVSASALAQELAESPVKESAYPQSTHDLVSRPVLPSSEPKPMKLSDLKGIRIERAQLHQGFALPNAGTETTLHNGRSGCKDIKFILTPQGLVIENKGKWAIIPLANIIGCNE